LGSLRTQHAGLYSRPVAGQERGRGPCHPTHPAHSGSHPTTPRGDCRN
jgi:hypothetical protein